MYMCMCDTRAHACSRICAFSALLPLSPRGRSRSSPVRSGPVRSAPFRSVLFQDARTHARSSRRRGAFSRFSFSARVSVASSRGNHDLWDRAEMQGKPNIVRASSVLSHYCCYTANIRSRWTSVLFYELCTLRQISLRPLSLSASRILLKNIPLFSCYQVLRDIRLCRNLDIADITFMMIVDQRIYLVEIIRE